MASPQLENGAIQIAHDLYLALERVDFNRLESRVIRAVIYLTYGAGKTKAEIQPEDIRYLLGAEKKLKTARIEETIARLLNRGVLFEGLMPNGTKLLGLQKDYDKWDKMSPTLQEVNIYINNTSSIEGDKMSPPERLLAYVQRKSKFKYGVSAYRVERKYAKQLYIEALSLTRSPLEALYLLKDFIDEHADWMQQKGVKFICTYLSSRFAAWAAQIPRKPLAVKEDEEALGKRYRYNVRLKQWEVAT